MVTKDYKIFEESFSVSFSEFWSWMVMFCCCFTAIQKLHSDMLLTKKLAFADGTLINCNTQWKAYLLLCNYYKINPFNFSNTCSMFIFILTQPKYICTEQNNKIWRTLQEYLQYIYTDKRVNGNRNTVGKLEIEKTLLIYLINTCIYNFRYRDFFLGGHKLSLHKIFWQRTL